MATNEVSATLAPAVNTSPREWGASCPLVILAEPFGDVILPPVERLEQEEIS
jgi:hypothetical protein